MHTSKKEIKYPENLRLKTLQTESGKSVTFIAKKLKVSRLVISNTLNGHYKGENLVPKILELISPQEETVEQ